MKFKELAQMTAEEQEKKFNELELELIKLNAQVATGTPPKNAGQLRRLKKDIARIMLIMHTKKKLDQKMAEKASKKPKEPKESVQAKLQIKSKKQGAKTEESLKNRKKKPKKQNE
jgi:ribosomal protein L29